MSAVATAIVGGAVIGGYMTSQATKSAAQTQADAAARAQGQLLEAGQEAADVYNPYVNKGVIALNKMSDDPYFTQQFTNKDLNATLAPGYDFRLKQGQQANLQASNVTGGMVGGNAIRSLQDYTQNFASGEYANAFNQFQTQRGNIYSNLRDIANFGLTGTTGQANAIIGTGTNIASLTNAAGNAQAASQIAQGNAYANMAGGITNAASYYGLSQMNQPINSNAVYGGSVGGGGFTPTSGNSFNLPSSAPISPVQVA
jgi:hypothetical protein